MGGAHTTNSTRKALEEGGSHGVQFSFVQLSAASDVPASAWVWLVCCGIEGTAAGPAGGRLWPVQTRLQRCRVAYSRP